VSNSRSKSGFPGYASKDQIYEYLQELNADKPVLEYCLFQPGTFTNYLAHPLQTADHLYISCTYLDVVKKQALIIEDGEIWHTYTTVQDTAKVVAKALSYPGKWPETGGIVGGRIKEKDLIKLAEEIKGTSMDRIKACIHKP
jgi:nucleoside-diphosphate-sugar epimerase